VHGVNGLDEATLSPHFEAVEQRLHIQPWPLSESNANNRVLWDGAGALGWGREPTRRNVLGCQALGYCGTGCPVGAKQSTDLTYVADAVRDGARVFARARVVRLEKAGRRISAVHAQARDAAGNPTGRKVVVRPRLVVLSAGAVGTPEILLRSGYDPSGRVGKRTFLHPVVASVASFANPIRGFFGAPQSVASHHFADRGKGKVGFFLEAVPVHPVLAGISLGGFGAVHEEQMARLDHQNALIALAVDGFLPGGGVASLRRAGAHRLPHPGGDLGGAAGGQQGAGPRPVRRRGLHGLLAARGTGGDAGRGRRGAPRPRPLGAAAGGGLQRPRHGRLRHGARPGAERGRLPAEDPLARQRLRGRRVDLPYVTGSESDGVDPGHRPLGRRARVRGGLTVRDEVPAWSGGPGARAGRRGP
jgi:hypothetical protein